MDNIEKVRMLRTLKTGRTSASKLFEEGAVITAPFPRMIEEEFKRRPQFFEVVELKRTEPEKPKEVVELKRVEPEKLEEVVEFKSEEPEKPKMPERPSKTKSPKKERKKKTKIVKPKEK